MSKIFFIFIHFIYNYLKNIFSGLSYLKTKGLITFANGL